MIKNPPAAGSLLTQQMGSRQLCEIVQLHIGQIPARVIAQFGRRHHNRAHARCFSGDHAINRIFQRHAVERIDGQPCGGIKVNLRM